MEKKEIIVDHFLCVACLCVGRALHNISDERMRRYYMETLNEVPLRDMPQVCPNICWECTAMLRKAVRFKEQVKDCYRILQTYTNEDLHECLLSDVMRVPRLSAHYAEPVSIPPSALYLPPLPDFLHVKTLENAVDRPVTVKEEARCNERLELQVAAGDAGEREAREAPDARVVCVKEEECGWGGDSDELLLSDRCPSVTEESIQDIEKDIKDILSETFKKKCTRPPSDEAIVKDEINSVVSKKKRKKRSNNLRVKVKKEDKINSLNIGKKISKHKTDGQKIKTIELSYEDMLLERQAEAAKESFTKAVYKCESCLIAFTYSKSYEAHISAKHSVDIGNYSCPICKTILASVDSFTSHYKRHMRRFECVECGKRTADANTMNQHYYSTHQIQLRRYTCNICGHVSNSIDTHRYHKDGHKARVECAECDKTFSHRAGLLNHRVTVHEQHSDFLCTQCGKTFRWKTSLKRHLEKHANKEPEAPAAFCSRCDVGFSSESSYRRHLRTSLKHVPQNQLRFICDHCGRRFADKTKLRDHIEEKHLHKTYICNICSKPSKNRVGLDQHIRNVHKGRPNNKVCHYCGKAFPTKVQLESHIRTHTGERPFICELCPTTFTQQSNLYKHNRQVHLNIKSKRYPITGKRRENCGPSAEPYKPRPHCTPDRTLL